MNVIVDLTSSPGCPDPLLDLSSVQPVTTVEQIARYKDNLFSMILVYSYVGKAMIELNNLVSLTVFAILIPG